jgi:hypothetical protein
MPQKAALPLGLLAVICSLLLAAPSDAQFSQIPRGCPAPTSMLNLRNPSDPEVTLERVDFDGQIHLPDSAIAQAVAKVNDEHWDANNPGWVNWFTENGLWTAWQEHGYYKSKVTAEAHSLSRDASKEKFLVTAHVDEGLQYHLGDLQFVNDRPNEVTPFSDSQLRTAFPLHEGEVFNVLLVRRGIERLTKLYASQGYVDFTVTAATHIDDELQRISLVLDLDRQKQFRVGCLDISGLNPSVEARLRGVIALGEIYNPDVMNSFLKENQLHPPDASFEIQRNQGAGTVDLIFDFRPCPPMSAR